MVWGSSDFILAFRVYLIKSRGYIPFTLKSTVSSSSSVVIPSRLPDLGVKTVDKSS